MAVELKILAWSCVLLLVHIFAAASFKTKQYGSKWNMGARDETLPPLEPVAGRLVRAQANFLETYPIAIVTLLGVRDCGADERMDRDWRLGMARGADRLPAALCCRRAGGADAGPCGWAGGPDIGVSGAYFGLRF